MYCMWTLAVLQSCPADSTNRCSQVLDLMPGWKLIAALCFRLTLKDPETHTGVCLNFSFCESPVEISELPLVRLDVSCNRISHVPLCYRHLRHLQTISLDSNPLQMPPAQICSKGKYHIFKYLNMEACKSHEELEKHLNLRPNGFKTW